MRISLLCSVNFKSSLPVSSVKIKITILQFYFKDLPVLQGRPLHQVVVELPDLISVQADVWKERDTYFGHQSQK